MKFSHLSVRALSALTLFFPILAEAYPPPCDTGDLFENASGLEAAHCIERKFLKQDATLQQRGGVAPMVRTFTPSRRTMKETVRKTYMHPTSYRSSHAGVFAERNIRLRKHPVLIRTLGASPSPRPVRQDLSERARLSHRTKQQMEKDMRRTNGRPRE